MQIQTNNAVCTQPAVSTSIRFLEKLTADYPYKNFAVRFWDGTVWGSTDRPRFTIVLKHPAALRNMFVSPSELSLGEAFVFDDFDITGHIESALGLSDFLLNHEYSLRDKLWYGGLLMKLPATARPYANWPPTNISGALHSKQRDRKAVSYHYDLSNDFYALWLDRAMVYSCGYFKSRDDNLEAAQAQKLDYICRKLRFVPGDHLLDIGCGWGGLLMHAAKNYGVQGFGITLSTAQAELARARIREAGLSRQCDVEVCDYRDLDPPQPFEKIVSVGMFEHVGEKLLPEYFRRVWGLLRPGGVFLNHGISASATFQRKGPSFIEKYVFPDGEIVPISVSLRAAENCGFEVRDVESLREHYVLTLRRWVRRLERRADQAQKLVGDKMYRVWRLYMSGSAYGFSTGRLNIHQTLFSKPLHGRSCLPLTREGWYQPEKVIAS